LVDIEGSNGKFKIARISKAVSTERTKLRKLIVRAEYFLDICRDRSVDAACGLTAQLTTSRWTVRKSDL
jgi:hypothetical protein